MSISQQPSFRTRILFVSIKRQSDRLDTITLPELEPFVERAWGVTLSYVDGVDRVVAVVGDAPVAAWRVRGAFTTRDLTWGPDDKPRVGLSLGDPLPILAAYTAPASMRRGAMVEERDVPPLPSERGDFDN